jgi:hypothetical protein
MVMFYWYRDSILLVGFFVEFVADNFYGILKNPISTDLKHPSFVFVCR